MAIKFSCPCGKVLASKDRDAGLPAICPHCGRTVMVPGFRQPEPDAAESFRRAAARVEYWIFDHMRQLWIGAALLSVVAIIGVAAVLRYWKQAPREPNTGPAVAAASPVMVTLDEQADPEKWRTSFDSFAVAVRQAIAAGDDLEAKFSKQEVRWTVTFAYAMERTQIYFAEAEPLRQQDKGILVWASLLTSEGAEADQLKPGDKITVSGAIGAVTDGNSAEHPHGYTIVRPVECRIE